MKKIILLFTVVCLTVSVALAQSQVNHTVDRVAQDMYTPSSSPAPSSTKNRGVGDAFPSTIGTKHVVGKTTYDLQTNGALQNRLIKVGSEVHAAWTLSTEANVTANSSYVDRGTGYAFHNGTAWGAPPTTRLEGTTRTGFGAMAVNGNGNVVYVAHSAAYDIMLNEKTASGWNTTTTTLNTSGIQAIWPDVATSGDWMYIICGSADSMSRTNGIRNGYYFSRSDDNGATWMDNAIPMPMIDSVGHFRGGGNSYSISARDSVVAIIFGDFGTDLTMLRSTDYGATWSRTVIWDWPIDHYNPSNMTDTNNNNQIDTIYTIDGSFDLAIDKDLETHVAFPIFRMYNDGPAVAGYNYFPRTSRMIYYNSIGDSLSLVDNMATTYHADCDGDSTTFLTIPNYTTGNAGDAAYNTISYCTMPQMSVNDDNNDVYIAYSTVVDGDQTEIDISHPYWLGISGVDGQPYRDVMVLASKDKGGTFGYPVNVTRTRHYEEVFASVPEVITGTHYDLLYQGDIEPGTIMQNDDTYDSDFENWMIYQTIPIADIHTESSNFSAPCIQMEVPFSTSDISNSLNGTINVYPNPAVDYVTVDLELDQKAKTVTYGLYDLMGRLISEVSHNNVTTDNVKINIQGLAAGNYLLKVRADNALSSHKVSVK